MFSVCPHWGGGGVRSESSRGGGQVSPAGGGGQVSPAEGVRSVQLGGGQDQPARGGSGPASRGGGVRSNRGGSASCAPLRAVCLLRSRRRTFLFTNKFKTSRYVERKYS